MSIKRYYGDNGELLRYEMRTRGARYSRNQKIINALIEVGLIVGSMSLLTVWYLINN